MGVLYFHISEFLSSKVTSRQALQFQNETFYREQIQAILLGTPPPLNHGSGKDLYRYKQKSQLWNMWPMIVYDGIHAQRMYTSLYQIRTQPVMNLDDLYTPKLGEKICVSIKIPLAKSRV